MKAHKFNKSNIMKEAHYWRNVLGYTMSEALSMAWRNAKKEVDLKENAKKKVEEYNRIKEYQRLNTKVANMSYLANSLASYYNRSSNAYYGD